MWIRHNQKVKHYCDAHDKLNYIKKFDDEDSEEIIPCCDDCLKSKLEDGYIITKKDTSKVDKNKVRKQLEEDEFRKQKENREKNKIRNFYAMSKLNLINRLFHLGNKIRKEVIEEYHKEMNVRDHIIKEVKRLDRGMFSVINCNFDGCGNFIVDSSHTGECFYYNDIDGECCKECHKIFYCEKHIFNFSVIYKSKDGELLCFCNTSSKKEGDENSQINYCAKNLNLIKN